MEKLTKQYHITLLQCQKTLLLPGRQPTGCTAIFEGPLLADDGCHSHVNQIGCKVSQKPQDPLSTFHLLLSLPGSPTRVKRNQKCIFRSWVGRLFDLSPEANMGAFLGEASKVPFILRRFQPFWSDRTEPLGLHSFDSSDLDIAAMKGRTACQDHSDSSDHWLPRNWSSKLEVLFLTWHAWHWFSELVSWDLAMWHCAALENFCGWKQGIYFHGVSWSSR